MRNTVDGKLKHAKDPKMLIQFARMLMFLLMLRQHVMESSPVNTIQFSYIIFKKILNDSILFNQIEKNLKQFLASLNLLILVQTYTNIQEFYTNASQKASKQLKTIYIKLSRNSFKIIEYHLIYGQLIL